MSPLDRPRLFEEVIDIALEAGRAIMEVYKSPIAVEHKKDKSPLTLADKRSHQVIADSLSRLTPGVPVLSEEGRDIPYEERRNWSEFWLVDPLDGTKEFIKRNGQFTVNIALIRNGRTAWGVVHAPDLGESYHGGAGLGAFGAFGGKNFGPITVNSNVEGGLTVVKSRSHPSEELEKYLEGIRVADCISVGSSLKFCAVARGAAHLYARFGPTMEWDTAAGQAVLEGAGGKVVTPGGAPFAYNKPSLLNGPFIASFGAFDG